MIYSSHNGLSIPFFFIYLYGQPLVLFQDGEIEADEYYRQKDHHERQISHWEGQTSSRERIMLELTLCVEAVKRLSEFWNICTGEDRKLLAHSLFDEIIYDLNARRIVHFKIRTWAEPFVLMRAALYEDEMGRK